MFEKLDNKIIDMVNANRPVSLKRVLFLAVAIKYLNTRSSFMKWQIWMRTGKKVVPLKPRIDKHQHVLDTWKK